jgi:hypothetical protein
MEGGIARSRIVDMSMEKVSLTIEKELLAEARAIAGGRALSRYLNRALRNQLQHDRLRGLLAELEQEKGQIDPDVMAEVRAAWPAFRERAPRRHGA